MTSLLYGFRPAPTYRGASPTETFEAALDMPLSRTSTFFDQAKGGILESFGLGTAIRDITIPEGKPEPRGALDILSPHPLLKTYDLTKRAVQSFINDEDSPALSEDAYKSSAWYREGVQWDAAMTEQRAAALAESFDAKKVREFYASKRPITAFIANLAGQAADPINYVPVAGPAVRAAAIARLGKVGGASVAASLDAAANTAIFGVATARTRARFGDDVSWQTTVSQIATAALIGAGFGAIGGALDRSPTVSRSAIEERLATLKTTQEARIALNEGIDALVHGEDIRLSPNAVEPVGRITEEVAVVARPDIPQDIIIDDVEIETIEGAAIKVGDRIVRGAVHAEAIDRAAKELGLTADELLDQVGTEASLLVPDGFVTSEGRFVSRAEAAQIDQAAQKRIAARKAARPDDLLLEESADTQPVRASDSSLTRTASWVVREKATKKPVLETFNPAVVEKLNTEKYEAVPIGQYLGEINGRPQSSEAIDTTPARPEPPPEGIKEAEKAIAKPDDYKALANQYRVDPDTGTFAEEADIAQLGIEGRLLDEDIATLAEAQDAYDNGAAYGEALKSVAGCLI